MPATTDLVTAISNGYIGEVPIQPKQIADDVHFMVTGRRFWRGTVFYYGEHTKELDELFGYTRGEDDD